MSIEELRLQFETFLLQAKVEIRERLLSYLKVEAQGTGKGLFEQLRVIRETVETALASTDDPVFYLRDLNSILRGTPPPLEKTGEQTEPIVEKPGDGTEFEEVDDVDVFLQDLRQRNERDLNTLKAQLDEYDKAGRSSKTKIIGDAGKIQQASFFHRDFKIVGQVGEPGQQDKLSYVSLIHQIEAGLKRGFDESEIVEAVIKAISPNSSLRSYILTLPERSLDKLRKILRVFYQEKNASDLYQELLTTCQGTKETAQQYLLRALDARNKVLFASKEEDNGHDYSQLLVQNAFLKAFETGLRDEGLLVNIRPVLRSKNVTDEELMRLVNELSAVQAQRKLKVGTSAKVSSVTPEPEPHQMPTKVSKDKHQMGQAFAEIKELRAELAALKLKQGGEPWHGRASLKQGGGDVWSGNTPLKGRQNDTLWMENVHAQGKRDFTQYDTAPPRQWGAERSPPQQSWSESIPSQQPWRQPMPPQQSWSESIPSQQPWRQPTPPQPSWREPMNQEINRYPYKRQKPPQEGPRYPYRAPEQAEGSWNSSRGFLTQPQFPTACPPCREKGVERCNHCFKCGKDGHFRRDCSNGNVSGNGSRSLVRDNK